MKRTSKLNKIEKSKKPFLKQIIPKLLRRSKKKEIGEISAGESAGKVVEKNNLNFSLQREKEKVEETKFTSVQEATQEIIQYNLPFRYADNRITLLARDPWWLHTYWDISENRVNEVISSIPVNERQNLKWIIRIYDVTEIGDFKGDNANSFFDMDVHFEANNWYINVNTPQRDWCVEIGFKNPMGKFFPVARSNVTQTPYFGISSSVDEEWVLPEDEYFKILGVYDLGKSSLERRKKLEEIIKHQISSPLASWGVSSLSSERVKEKDKFFLEVWTELILYGRTMSDAKVTVEGKKVNLRPDGTFTLRYALPVGDFKFEVTGVSKNDKHKIKRIPAVKRFDKKID